MLVAPSVLFCYNGGRSAIKRLYGQFNPLCDTSWQDHENFHGAAGFEIFKNPVAHSIDAEARVMVHEKESFISAMLESIHGGKETRGEALEKISKLYADCSAAIKSVGTMLEIISDEFQAEHDHNPIHHIERRLKSPQSIMDKLARKGLDASIENVLEHITDVAGLRLVCPYIEDVYALSNLFLSNGSIELIK
jgi:hypothetical protein